MASGPAAAEIRTPQVKGAWSTGLTLLRGRVRPQGKGAPEGPIEAALRAAHNKGWDFRDYATLQCRRTGHELNLRLGTPAMLKRLYALQHEQAMSARTLAHMSQKHPDWVGFDGYEKGVCHDIVRSLLGGKYPLNNLG